MKRRAFLTGSISFLLSTCARPAYAAEPEPLDETAGDKAMQDFYSLKQPDSSQSCCGPGDAYHADEVETDADGNLVAIITDTRPDRRRLPNGGVIVRPHIPPGTKFVVPKNKIRTPPAVNPTGHNVIFIGQPNEWDIGGRAEGGYTVYCWEPAPLT